ncbi:MAG: hypothetical protein SCH39_11845, partial [Methanosarcinales archaeon]|nr:hypothetical protein [Methanosarcinales archaeon]
FCRPRSAQIHFSSSLRPFANSAVRIKLPSCYRIHSLTPPPLAYPLSHARTHKHRNIGTGQPDRGAGWGCAGCYMGSAAMTDKIY